MIIGLTGRAGSGKDYVVEALRETVTVTRFAWADELRHEIEAALNDGYYLSSLWKKPYSDEVRRLLQWWGFDLRRANDPNYWVDKMKGQLLPFAVGGSLSWSLAAVTDCRFPNEIEAVRDMGGVIVRVWAPEHVRAQRLGGILPPDHASETMLDNIAVDITLDNTVTPRPRTSVDAAKWDGLLRKVQQEW